MLTSMARFRALPHWGSERRWLLRSTRVGVTRGELLLAAAILLSALLCVAVALLSTTTAPKFALALPVVLLGAIVALRLMPFRRLLLAVMLIDLPLQLDSHLAFSEEAERLGAIVGFNISVTTLALIALYGLWLVESLQKRGAGLRLQLRHCLAPIAYVIVVGLSVFYAERRTFAMFELFLLAQMLLLFIYLVSTTRTRADVELVVAMLAIGLSAEGLIMLSQRFLGFPQDNGANMEGRFGGTLGGVNPAGIYFSLVLAPVVGALLSRSTPWLRMLAMSALILGTTGLVLTFARGGWITFGLSAAIMCILCCRRGWLSPTLPTLAVLGGIIGMLIFRDALLWRFLQDDQGSALSRGPLMDLALRMIAASPILGVGANNYGIAMVHHLTPNFAEYGGDWLYVVHNKYLMVWAETGLFGVLSYLAILLTTIRVGWRGWMLHDRFLSPIALGVFAVMFGHMLHLSVDIFSGRPQVQTLWIISALATAIANMSPTPVASEPARGVRHAG